MEGLIWAWTFASLYVYFWMDLEFSMIIWMELGDTFVDIGWDGALLQLLHVPCFAGRLIQSYCDSGMLRDGVAPS